MRFDLTDDQRAVREAIDELCRSRWPGTSVRRYAAGEDDGTSWWKDLASGHWLGIAIPEAHGGQGLGMVELTLVCEALGRALAPGNFFGNAAAALLIGAAGNDAQKSRLLPGLASGESRAALVTLLADGGALAYDVEGASVVVAVAPGHALVAAADTCRFEPVEGADLTRRLSRVTLPDGEPLAGDVDAGLDRVEVALSAELVGVADRALDLAVDHARTREQFGHPIGVYQAVSHRCADMLLDVESARSAVLCAAWTADNSPGDLPFAASVAKVTAAQGSWRTTTASLQVHGGIGFTWEHDCHLLLRRAMASGHMLGSPGRHLDRVAAQRGLAAAP